MKDFLARYTGILFTIALFFVSGCGYTTHSLLPSEFKSIYVQNFTNQIIITDEQTDKRMYRGYKPGMERDLTREVIDKFLSDGNLKIKNDRTANIVLKGELIDFRKEALRYDDNNNVEEYRIVLTVNMELEDTRTGKAVWSEKAFSGESTYRTSGNLAQSEEAALKTATQDLARRIVERTVEGW